MKVIFHLFLQSATLGRKRAFLTIAAIAWGTVAILLLLAFGEGLKRQLGSNARAMGENIGVMWMSETTKAWKGMNPGRPIRVRIDDLPVLKSRLPELEDLIGEAIFWRTNLTSGRKTVAGRVKGVSVAYGEARKQYPVEGGRFLSPLDEAERRRVIFLGNELAEDLFGKEDPVGKTMLVAGAPFTVVGVMQKKTQMGAYAGMDKDHSIIPISTWKALFGRPTVNNLVVKVSDPAKMKDAIARTREVIAAKYGFDPSDERALPTWDTVESQKTTRNMTVGIQIFLGIIGALTLLIGGVGVANIMYAVVKERTREIGVKMALGAKAGWITGPFVLEGLSYTLVGGAAGMLIATLMVLAMSFIPTDGNQVMEFLGTPKLSPAIGAATASILGVIGLLAGWFPARRAAAVDPAATLRYE
ncbi:MAG TPA: ABC transporter permease [Thermoanaerobaculia bacterium]|nr:ABC transporter permease [Thermoanaerobaculia bacterium]